MSDLRTTAKHRREKQPLGTTCWRTHKRPSGGRYKVKMIKVAHAYYGGSGRWINYSRYLFEKHKGPVPAGKRVIHRDGDLRNFDLDNLILGTAADVVFLFGQSTPAKAAKNRKAVSEATSAFNRERAAIRRQLGVLPTRWYPVDLAKRTIINTPGRKLHNVTGAPHKCNGSGLVGWRLGWPGMPAIDASALAVLVLVGGLRSYSAIVDLIARLRAELLITPATVTATALRSTMTRLTQAGLVERVSPGLFVAADKARATRGPVCPFVFLRGVDLQREPYTQFALVTPAEAA